MPAISRTSDPVPRLCLVPNGMWTQFVGRMPLNARTRDSDFLCHKYTRKKIRLVWFISAVSCALNPDPERSHGIERVSKSLYSYLHILCNQVYAIDR